MRKILVFLLLIIALFSCQKKADVILIGVAGPMTGPQAKMGGDFKNAVQLAVEEWNQAGGLLGKKIEIIVGDDQADPKQAVSVANKFVNKGVAGILGHFNSSCSIPASDIYNRAGIVMITPASTNPALTEKGYKNVFRVCGRDDQQGHVAARFVIDNLKLKKVAILHDKTTYGQGLADEFKKSLGTAVEVIYYGGINIGEKDFRTVLTALKTKGPELLYFGGIYPEAGLLIKQSRELGIDVPFMSGDGAIDPMFIQIAGRAAEGAYFTFSPDPEHIPSARGFIEKYKMRFGQLGPYSIYAYDAANILFTAIKEANTTDGQKISEKLRAMTFTGALGTISFDDKGDVTKSPYVVWTAKADKFQELWRPQ